MSTDAKDPVSALLAGVRQYADSTDDQTARDALVAGAKQFLADLDDTQFSSLIAEVRPPAEDPNAYPANWGYNPEGNR